MLKCVLLKTSEYEILFLFHDCVHEIYLSVKVRLVFIFINTIDNGRTMYIVFTWRHILEGRALLSFTPHQTVGFFFFFIFANSCITGGTEQQGEKPGLCLYNEKTQREGNSEFVPLNLPPS